MDEVDIIQEQMANISKVAKILKKITKEMLESKRAVIEIKNDIGEFISRLAHDVERDL